MSLSVLDRKSISSIVSKLISSIIGFVITVFISRNLLPEANGMYNYLVAFVSLCILVLNFSAESGIAFYVAKENGKNANSILNFSWVVSIIQTIVLWVLFFVFSKFGSFSNLEVLYKSEIWKILLLYYFFLVLSSNLNGIYIGLGKYNASNILNIASGTLQMILLVAVYVYGNKSDNSFALKALVFSAAFLVFIQMVHLVAFVGLKINTDVKFIYTFKLLKNFVLFSGIINIVQFLAYRIDYWFVEKYCSAFDLGNYTIASKIIQWFWLLPMAVVASMYADLVASKKETNLRFNKTMFSVFSIMIVGVIIFYVFGNNIIDNLFGINYTKVASCVNILLPGASFFIFSIFISSYFSAHKKLKINFYASLFTFILIALLDYILVPTKGIFGAALASSIGYGIAGLGLLVYFNFSKERV